MFIEERHQAILKTIRECGRISIGEIQEKFNVSNDSARRDLRLMEGRKLLKRTRGGAIPLNQVGFGLPCKWHMTNMQTVFENYDAIARKAVEFIKPNDSVFLTSGSIGYIMIKYLPTDFEYRIVTNSVDNASLLRDCDNICVYLAGGQMRQNGRIVDSFAQEFVKNMRFDVSFLTGAGFTAEYGLSNTTADTCAFQKQIADNTRQNIALVPSQKLGIEAFIRDVDASKFEILITDWDAVEDEVNKAEEKGLQVIVVEKVVTAK
jgi:DeoR family transcriptional regulator, fructose operon transcriptional repressor